MPKRPNRRRVTRKHAAFRDGNSGRLVEDEELAEAMKERGSRHAGHAARDTIDGLIYQKYMHRNQRELVPTAKAEQLIQFLTP